MKCDEGHLNHLIFDLKLQIKKKLNIHNKATRKKKIKTYYKTHDKIKIHFGGGKDHLKDFLNMDIIGKIPINMAKKLPFPSESVDIIYSCHVIEHFIINNLDFF